MLPAIERRVLLLLGAERMIIVDLQKVFCGAARVLEPCNANAIYEDRYYLVGTSLACPVIDYEGPSPGGRAVRLSIPLARMLAYGCFRHGFGIPDWQTYLPGHWQRQ